LQEKKMGLAKIGSGGLSWMLSNKTILHFPYASGSNIPIILTKKDSNLRIGLTYHDLQPLTDSTLVSAYLGVADKTNQNITLSQNELLCWHWRLGRINFQWIQMLVATPRDLHKESILQTKQPIVPSCPLPLCLVYQLASKLTGHLMLNG
jgi:hypothetical protein